MSSRNDCMWVKRSMPLSNYVGLVESFSSYQTLLREYPQEAIRLSKDICQRYLPYVKHIYSITIENISW